MNGVQNSYSQYGQNMQYMSAQGSINPSAQQYSYPYGVCNLQLF